jgi:hypothetical protein
MEDPQQPLRGAYANNHGAWTSSMVGLILDR